MILQCVQVTLLCSALLWSPAAQGPADSKLRAEAEDDIEEAVLIKQMMEWVASGDRSEKEGKTKTNKEIAHYGRDQTAATIATGSARRASRSE